MKLWSYNYSGLRITSELPLPEWSAFESSVVPTTPAVVSIVLDSTPDRQPGAEELLPFVSASEYRFHVAKVGSYRVRDGREIVVRPEAEADKSEIRLFLLGSAWAALCYQRNLLVFHASAVRVGDEVVAFCAPAGGGKSSLAAWLSTEGYSLVSDDLCRFEMPLEGPPRVYPSAPRLKLWQDAIDELGWNRQDLTRDHFRMEKFHVPVSVYCSQEPLPLRAIYLLEWGESRLLRLSGRSALRRFMSAATYHADLLRSMGLLVPYWHNCLRILQRVPVWELQRPRDLGAMNRAIDLLNNHW